jgi:hypothetical protein
MGLFEEFHDNALDVRRLNYGIITLLPKTKEANKIQQFRPICMLNCLYKWFTKVMTIRLDPVAKRIIHKAQAAFIRGRNIINNVLTLHEILHETKRLGAVGVVLKLDFEKAYDKIHWVFLMQYLVIRGFHPIWCEWVRKVLQDGIVAVKLNGSVGPYFQSCKGVRQEGPFLLCYSIL